DERVWIGAYIAVRREWLATHPNPLLHRTVYRMDTFAALAEAGNWNLDLPFEAHGVLLDEQAISGEDAAQTAAPSIAGSA
ncbi:MAG TPA: hypothetical protein VKG84_04610, partial [Candidatus Acidoferrales bacterium]|nr:hypothetical protein [Candidatus Acidoferrales bacterium]